MTLVKTRAAFEKAVTDAVKDVDPTVKMVYDNVGYTRPGKTVKYIVMTVNFGQATQQAQGAAPRLQQAARGAAATRGAARDRGGSARSERGGHA